MWRQDDARYRFTLTLAKQTQEPPRLLFHHAERIERLQARQYFRVRCNQPVTAGIINVPPGEPIENLGARPDLRQLRGRLVSISAGGLAVEMMANLTARDIIRVPLRLQGFKPVTVAARVVGSEPRGAGNYLVRGEFVDISEDTRDVVAQYVWRRQKPVFQNDS
jgi:c-di-GMP-binding flagellar brake protein YcgR